MLRGQLERWAAQVRDELRDAYPEMPDGLEDRPADVWEPLLAVADAAGGDWPQRARVAAVALVAQTAEGPQSLGVLLLQHIAYVFTELREIDQLATADLIDRLCELDEAPWGDLRGKPLDARGLARRLKPYEINGRSVRVQERVVRGYAREDFHDAWSRYLPGPPPQGVRYIRYKRYEPRWCDLLGLRRTDDRGRARAARAPRLRLDRSMTCPLPANVAALVRAGHLEEVEPGVFRRSRLPSRAEVHGEQHTPDRPSEPSVPEEPNP